MVMGRGRDMVGLWDVERGRNWDGEVGGTAGIPKKKEARLRPAVEGGFGLPAPAGDGLWVEGFVSEY